MCSVVNYGYLPFQRSDDIALDSRVSACENRNELEKEGKETFIAVFGFIIKSLIYSIII